MKGQDLFEFYTSQDGPYSQVLFTAYREIGDDLFPMLEEAEEKGAKIILTHEDGIDDAPITVKIDG